MAVETVTDLPTEDEISGVRFDHRTAGGLPLPHPLNPPLEGDVLRIRYSIMALAALVAAGIDETSVRAIVDQEISKILGESSEFLDTFEEIANALGNDPDFATTILNALAQKADIDDLVALAARVSNAENVINNTTQAVANLRLQAFAYSLAYGG